MSQTVSTDTKTKVDTTNTAEAPGAMSGVKVIKLDTPIKVNGQQVTELRLDFKSLSCTDMMNIENEMQADGRFSFQNPILSTAYCIYVAARAAGLNIDDIRPLGYEDTHKVLQAVQNFSGKSEG